MKIALATSGMMLLKEAIGALAGGETQLMRSYGRSADLIAGWGHKPTAARARQTARRRGVPYIAFEDGFLRSVQPGNTERPASLILDRTGIYYDASCPSDLEANISRRLAMSGSERAGEEIVAYLRRERLSKYNTVRPEQALFSGGEAVRGGGTRVLVVDQTAGDASIPGALATDTDFADMLLAAVLENPQADIVVRIHPETLLGTKPGHFSPESLDQLASAHEAVARAASEKRLHLSSDPVNPWDLLERCSKVYCVSSQLGFEALMASCEVHCFGMPFYGGWGLTADRKARPTRRRDVPLTVLVAAAYLDYCRYFDFERGIKTDFWRAAEALKVRRDQHFAAQPE
ncbi:hypothetical protein [Roseibium denhamense]|uniref:Capsule polysaccharide biosynthesis protein n=1 Tax=Roseibium denhamense TaxID=76305 RepID=A0ABY1PMG1_9HYPH|nr:hypothetical protein [Roseibium denhamense]SMP37422.1 Capsule polysaccharide biosynthesis protein [Roseibium denhamense]